MATEHLIGVDIGTQGTKTSLFQGDGVLVCESFQASRLISLTAGQVEQDAEEILDSVVDTIREVVLRSGVDAKSICSIGIDGQMAGIIGIDKDHHAVTPYDSWLDMRCSEYVQVIKERAEDRVINLTGCPVTNAHGPKVLWWKHEMPEVYRKIHKFVVPSAYVVGRLAGLGYEQAYIDTTHLHFSGFGDTLRNMWSDELLDTFDVDKGRMPEIVEPCRIVGTLTEESARRCGLRAGTPLVAGCGDQAATSLGAGITRPGRAFDVAGTASVFSCCVDEYRPDIKHRTLLYPRSVIPGLWTPLAYIAGGGLCLRWFKENMTGRAEHISYEELDREAAEVPQGCDGLIFHPYLAGRACPNDPKARGSWTGLSLHHTRGHLYRSILEGIAYEYGLYQDILVESLGGAPIERVSAVGGGAASLLFCTIKADVLGVSYQVLRTKDSATFGSAVVAGHGVGLIADMADFVERRISSTDEIVPDVTRHGLYKDTMMVYRGNHDAI